MKSRVTKCLGAMLVLGSILVMMSLSVFAAGKVQNVKQTGAGTDSVTVSWDANLEKNVDYSVYISQDGVNWGESYDETSDTKITLSKLTQSRIYYVRVVAVVDKVSGVPSDAIQVATRPDMVTNIGQTGATLNSVTLEWPAIDGADCYNIYADQDKSALLATVTTNSATIGGLSSNNKGEYFISAVKKSANGYTAESYLSWLSGTSTVARTLPAKLGNSTFNAKYNWLGDSIGFERKTPTNADGTQVEAYNVKTKKKVLKVTDSGSIAIKAGSNKFMKYRVRAYIEIGTQIVPGPWSDYKYFAYQTVQASTVSKKAIKASWKKVTGASRYTVYVSTSDSSGWKKVKTVSSKTKSIKITKYGKKKLKKNTRYYVKVVPQVKVGKKYIKSELANTASAYTKR